MSREDHVVAVSNLHVMEPPDLWQRYIDPAFRRDILLRKLAPRG